MKTLLTLIGSAVFIAVLAVAAMYALVDSHETGEAHAGLYVPREPGDTIHKRLKEITDRDEKRHKEIMDALKSLSQKVDGFTVPVAELKIRVKHLEDSR